MSRLLSVEERKRFSQWLKEDIESNKLLIEQMERLPGTKVIIERKKQEMIAGTIIAELLDSISDF